MNNFFAGPIKSTIGDIPVQFISELDLCKLLTNIRDGIDTQELMGKIKKELLIKTRELQKKIGKKASQKSEEEAKKIVFDAFDQQIKEFLQKGDPTQQLPKKFNKLNGE